VSPLEDRSFGGTWKRSGSGLVENEKQLVSFP